MSEPLSLKKVDAPRVQWEYSERVVGGGQSPLEQLNQAGADGWELIMSRVEGANNLSPVHYLYFKRRKS